MRIGERQFQPKAPTRLVARLAALPSGAEVRVRAVAFIKSGRQWHNDFRVGMTSAEVASCLVSGDYTITERPVEPCELDCGSNVCVAYNRCQRTVTPKEH